MNSIPLIKGNTPQEINTSIIALKKALSELEAQDRLLQGTDKDVQDKIKQINELIEGINTHLGTVDTHLTTIDGQITALQPVNTVTSGNMQSVTSNAVANSVSNLQTQISGKASGNGNVSWAYFTPQQFNDATYLSNLVNSLPAGSLIIFTVGWEDYQQYPYYGSSGYIMVSAGSARAYGEMREFFQPIFKRAFYWVDNVTPDKFSGVYTI